MKKTDLAAGDENPRCVSSIPVELVGKPREAGSPARALAVLHQIQALLETFIASGQTASIDLRRLPLGADERDYLERLLGHGEVNARLDALGPTLIRETAVSGVWWITHRNRRDKILGEFIEVTACPDLFKTSPDELRAGQRLLRNRLSSAQSEKRGSNDDDRGLQVLGLQPGARPAGRPSSSVG